MLRCKSTRGSCPQETGRPWVPTMIVVYRVLREHRRGTSKSPGGELKEGFPKEAMAGLSQKESEEALAASQHKGGELETQTIPGG